MQSQYEFLLVSGGYANDTALTRDVRPMCVCRCAMDITGLQYRFHSMSQSAMRRCCTATNTASRRSVLGSELRSSVRESLDDVPVQALSARCGREPTLPIHEAHISQASGNNRNGRERY
jgi:hypothetical protein